ncbi:hypothetical protein KC19_5G021800 [Ceratodon purpureus]|uniref:Uncharacterized protein n=1 Tax=Ceratodon purpureus TaxID=3225 RepID=A0A8T0HY10_CERPU|nr:hypothetical protein KC19_5G021800 [Ceratodon purpureus]
MRIAKMMQLQVLITTIFLTSVAASQTCGPTALNCSDPTPCCSNSNSCGNTTVHCGIGCLSQYSAPGACISSKESSGDTTIAATTPEPRCGIDPTSGKNNGICKAKDYCCNPYGYCGVGDTHCIGCQKGYGRCPTLCDPSKLCGGYGIASFTISVLSLSFALVGLVVQIKQCYNVRRNSPNAGCNIFSIIYHRGR